MNRRYLALVKKKGYSKCFNQHGQAWISYNFRTGLSLCGLVQGHGPLKLGIFYWFGAQLGSLTQNSIYPFTLISVVYQGLHCPFSLVKNKKCIYNIMFNNDFNLFKCISSCNLKFWIKNSFNFLNWDFSWENHLGGVLLSAPFIMTVTVLQQENYHKK